MGFTKRDVAVALTRLVAEGWVRRLRRGLYLSLDPFTKEQRAHPFLIGTSVSRPSAVSHWSALQHWGLTEQIPDRTTVSIVRQLRPMPDSTRLTGASTSHLTLDLADALYEFVRIRPARLFGVTEEWFDKWRVPLFDRERALLDCFLQPEYFGSITVGLDMLERHVGELDIPKLAGYAVRVKSPHTSMRLGWALEQAGAAAPLVESLRGVSISPSTRVRLEPGGSRRGQLVRRWHLMLNR